MNGWKLVLAGVVVAALGLALWLRRRERIGAKRRQEAEFSATFQAHLAELSRACDEVAEAMGRALLPVITAATDQLNAFARALNDAVASTPEQAEEFSQWLEELEAEEAARSDSDS